MARSFGERLRAAMQRGGLITSDLRWWFNRPWATVRTWVFFDHEPMGPAGEVAWEDLERLEQAVHAGGEWFPIPRELPWLARREHVKQARTAHADARLSAPRAAARGR